jgi:peptide/nickel transport system substrate-binding protein
MGAWLIDKKRLLLAGLAVSLVGLLALACSSAEDEAPVPTPAAPAPAPAPAVAAPAPAVAAPAPAPIQTKRGGILRKQLSSSILTWDLAETQSTPQHVLSGVYSMLVRGSNEAELVVEGDLARDWEISEGGTTYTFNLHPNATFSNGDPLTSEDVKFSFERVLNPPGDMASPRQGKISVVERIEAPDPTSVVFKLKGASPDFLTNLTDSYFVTFNKAFTEPLDQAGVGLKNSWLGSGPYTIERTAKDERHEVRRREDYWKPGLPYLDGIDHIRIDGEAIFVAALETGRLDFAYYIWNPANGERLKDRPGIVAEIIPPGPAMTGFFMNLTKAPWNDIRVRRAIALAVDWDTVFKQLRPTMTFGIPGYGILPDSLSQNNLSAQEFATYPGYDTYPGLGGDIEANRAKARQLLKEAGVSEGERFGILTQSNNVPFEAPAVILAEQLKQIGLDIFVDGTESGTYYSRERNLDWDLNHHAMGMNTLTADSILGIAWISTGARNYGKWENSEIDALYTQQSTELDPIKRSELIREMARLHLDNAYSLFMVTQATYHAHIEELKGRAPHGSRNANWHFETAWLEK